MTNVSLQPIRLYGCFFPHHFALLKGESNELLWHEKTLKVLANKRSLKVIFEPDTYDFYIGFIPHYSWQEKEQNNYCTNENAAKEVILNFLNKYYELSGEQYLSLKNTIGYINTVLIKKEM